MNQPTAARSRARKQRRPLHWLRRRLRSRLLALARRVSPPGDQPIPPLERLEKVLVVYVNFRLGNALLATAGLQTLRGALPGAQIDFLGGPPARHVTEGQGLEQCFFVSRRGVRSPRALLRLVRRLRRERYDAAIHLSTATGSMGALLVRLSGATHRIGCRRKGGNVHFSLAVKPPRARHKVDRLHEYLAELGVSGDAERRLFLTEPERRWAAERLEGVGERPPVAFFPGARVHRGKGWSLAHFAWIAEQLRREGIASLVFLGPEESDRREAILQALPDSRCVEEPDPRRVAALVARCGAALTLDSGPMHLCVASGAPTAAVFRQANFDKWGPRAPQGVSIYDPEDARPEDALAALRRLYRAAR